MATPNKPMYPVLTHTEKVNANTATTGVKLSYVVPAGRVTLVRAASAFATAGATQVLALQAIIGGVTVNVVSWTPSGTIGNAVWLQAGDTIQLNCTTLLAASTTDLTITCEDYEAQ